MALSQRLQLRQSHALVMTPQLMQAIKLLQLSNLDLVGYVESELERNPLLERTGEGEAEARAASAGAGRCRRRSPGCRLDRGQLRGAAARRWRSARTARSAAATTASRRRRAPSAEQSAGYTDWTGAGTGRQPDGEYNLEAFVSAERTLADHLAEQLVLAVVDPARRLIGQYLIDLVDEAGYLTGDLAHVADKLGAPLGAVEAMLAVLQSFDPPGVCARNLTECLAIQLRERNRFDPAMQALVAHLDLLAKRDLAGLKKACGVSEEDLIDMIAEIRHLNPKPGLAFGTTLVQPIVPDVFVRPGVDGGFLVELNSETLPKVLVNQSYYTQVAKTARNDQEKTYLADCLQTATWLIRALDQRARTILKVSTEIVRQQDAFFVHGVQHLRPLNLKTVADAISMHEFDGLARHRQQIHGDQPRHLRAEIFLHLGDRGRRRQRGPFRRGGAPPHQAAHRCREPARGALRRHHRGAAARRRHRDRAAHRRQISRGHAHTLLGAAPAREADLGAGEPREAPRPRPPSGGARRLILSMDEVGAVDRGIRRCR